MTEQQYAVGGLPIESRDQMVAEFLRTHKFHFRTNGRKSRSHEFHELIDKRLIEARRFHHHHFFKELQRAGKLLAAAGEDVGHAETA